MDNIIVKFVIQHETSGKCDVVEYANCENKYHVTRLINVYKPKRRWHVIEIKVEFPQVRLV